MRDRLYLGKQGKESNHYFHFLRRFHFVEGVRQVFGGGHAENMGSALCHLHGGIGGSGKST